jgi:hypothetical protein
MRLEGENLVFKQKQVLQKGEEFTIDQGLGGNGVPRDWS